MKKQQQNIDELFREALGGLREAPPPAAWTDIEKRLDQNERRRRGFFLLRWPWMASVVLTLGAGTWLATSRFAPAKESAAVVRYAAPAPVLPAAGLNPPPPAAAAPRFVQHQRTFVTGTSTARPQDADAGEPHEPAAAVAAQDRAEVPLMSPLPAAAPLTDEVYSIMPHGFQAPAPQKNAIAAAVYAPMQTVVGYPPELSNAVGSPAVPAATATNAGAQPAAPAETPSLLPPAPLRFTYGADLGYEFGLRTAAPGRYVAGLSLSWEFAPRFSLGIQPAYRFGKVARQQLSPGSVTVSESEINTHTTVIYDTNNYAYTYLHVNEEYDSTVVNSTQSGGGRFWELSLPLTLQYQTPSGWSFGAGPTFNFGGAIGAGTGGEKSVHHVAKADSIMVVKSFMQPPTYNTRSNTKEEVAVPDPVFGPGAAPGSMRLGYVLNVGYRWRQFMLSATLSQQLTGYGRVDQRFRSVYSSPYLQLTLGYRLSFNLRRPSGW